MSRLLLFLRAFKDDWVAGTAGSGAVMLTVIAIILHLQSIPVWAFWLTAAACGLVSSYRVWSCEHSAVEALEARISGFPLLEFIPNSLRSWMGIVSANFKDAPVRDAGSTSIETTGAVQTGFVISVAFKNNPKKVTAESVARGVVCEIKFYDAETGNFIRQTTGRWSLVNPNPEHEQWPPPRATGFRIPMVETIITNKGEAAIDLLYGQDATLYVAFWGFSEDKFYAFDNTPVRYPELSELALIGHHLRAIIRLRCPYFDQSWQVDFKSPEQNEKIKLVGVKKLPSQTVESQPNTERRQT